MAALLRQGARRIGGPVLQRTQAAVTSPAVAEERRRLVPRLMHTEEQATDVQQQKENLYEALSKVEKHLTWQDERLLQHLAVQVNPRPKDKQWRRLRLLKWVSNVWMTSAIISLASVIAAGSFGLKSYVAEKERGPDSEKQEQ
ncbi:hypothetical protein ACQ4PT_014487 [Festuca glaucescens]